MPRLEKTRLPRRFVLLKKEFKWLRLKKAVSSKISKRLQQHRLKMMGSLKRQLGQ
jgi:hypothetical protein